MKPAAHVAYMPYLPAGDKISRVFDQSPDGRLKSPDFSKKSTLQNLIQLNCERRSVKAEMTG